MFSASHTCKNTFPNEASLIKGIQAGDKQAIGCLYRHLYKKAFPSVKKLVKNQHGNDEDAEDLFQEAFLKFRRKILEGSYVYQEKVAVATYFYELYHYAWRDELKSARRRKQGGEVSLHLQSGEESAEHHMLRSEREKKLRAQVERLGEQCAMLLKLFIWHSWTLESIAEKMGITPQSAKNQKYRCMKRLKEAYVGK